MAPKPTTATTTTAAKPWRLRFAAVMQFICQLLCTLLLLLCLCFFCPAALGVLFTFRIGFHFFMSDSFRPATLPPTFILPPPSCNFVAVCVHFAYERASVGRTSAASGSLASPRFPYLVVPAVTIKKLNTKFTLSLDGLASWHCHHCHWHSVPRLTDRETERRPVSNIIWWQAVVIG